MLVKVLQVGVSHAEGGRTRRRASSYLRQRANVIRYGGQHIQQMEKALEQMNLKLRETISDITGQTGQDIIRAILRGIRDPVKLAKWRVGRSDTNSSVPPSPVTE